VRIYKREGLLEELDRRTSGYRQYPEEVVARLRFLRQAKGLGFTLKEIRELLDLRPHPGVPPADVKERTLDKLADVETKMQVLQRIKAVLLKLIGACPGPSSGCLLRTALDSLEGS